MKFRKTAWFFSIFTCRVAQAQKERDRARVAAFNNFIGANEEPVPPGSQITSVAEGLVRYSKNEVCVVQSLSPTREIS